MKFLDVLFGCSHKNLSFPITVRAARSRTNASVKAGTYVVCLDCGHEFPYDWNETKIVSSRQPKAPAQAAPQPRRVA
jgi:hypothetical protein